MRRLALIAALILAALLTTAPAFAATSGVSVDHSQGVLKLGDGTANCSHAADTGTVRFNSSTNRLEYCVNGSGWKNVNEGPGALISTQTASNSASLQWTGLTGADYILTCKNIIDATAIQSELLQFGEGGTPTWKTANYNFTIVDAYNISGGGVYENGSVSGSGFTLAGSAHAAPGDSWQIHIFSLSSGTAYKTVTGTVFGYDNNSVGMNTQQISGYYTGDTTAVTAIRVIAQSGNITSGSCSLYLLSN